MFVIHLSDFESNQSSIFHKPNLNAKGGQSTYLKFQQEAYGSLASTQFE